MKYENGSIGWNEKSIQFIEKHLKYSQTQMLHILWFLKRFSLGFYMKRVLSAALLYCHFFAIIWLFFVCLFYVKIYCYILNECFIVDILFKIVHRFVGFVLQFSWFKCSFAIKMANGNNTIIPIQEVSSIFDYFPNLIPRQQISMIKSSEFQYK